MRKTILLFLCLAFTGNPRRVQTTLEQLSSGTSQDNPLPPGDGTGKEQKHGHLEEIDDEINTLEKNVEKAGKHDEERVEKVEKAAEEKVEKVEKPSEDKLESVVERAEKAVQRAKAATARSVPRGLEPTSAPPAPPPVVEESPPAAAPLVLFETLWKNQDVQRVLMLLTIIVMGKLLQQRFPAKDAEPVQRMLLQFLVPATLFKGLSKEKIEPGHLVYIAGGCGMVLVRLFCSYIVSCLVMSSQDPKLRRTAFFQIGTMASALSVLPFLGEFVGHEYVGLGGMVDLPMKLYMLILMPILLRNCGGSGAPASSSQAARGPGIVAQLLKDPITLSMIFGFAMALISGGAGTRALGFAGQAIDKLAEAQTPVLFLLIGLKLKFESSTPLYCIVLLMASQGFLLLCVYGIVKFAPLSEVLKRFVILFAQGAPSVVGMGVIASAVKSGVQGYSTEFAFDIVGMAFPISSFMQCLAGILGNAYEEIMPFVAGGLIAFALLLRCIFSRKFKMAPPASVPQSSAAERK